MSQLEDDIKKIREGLQGSMEFLKAAPKVLESLTKDLKPKTDEDIQQYAKIMEGEIEIHEKVKKLRDKYASLVRES